MKKIFAITTLILVFACGNVFAATLTTGNVTAEDGETLYGGNTQAISADAADSTLLAKCSKGVRAGLAFDLTHYALATKHDSGNKAFGTSYDSTAIYNTDLGTGALSAAPSEMNESAYLTWTEM